MRILNEVEPYKQISELNSHIRLNIKTLYDVGFLLDYEEKLTHDTDLIDKYLSIYVSVLDDRKIIAAITYLAQRNGLQL